MDEELKSPPYPQDSYTVLLLLIALADLRKWLIHYREWANGIASEYSGQEIIVVPEELPEVMGQDTFVRMISVMDIGRTFAALRAIREHWDFLIRVHEDAWDSRLAITQRLRCVRGGYALYLDAFLTPEFREAQKAKAHQESHSVMRQLMQKLGMPDNGTVSEMEDGLFFSVQEQHKHEIDFDALFHATDKLDEPSDGTTQE